MMNLWGCECRVEAKSHATDYDAGMSNVGGFAVSQRRCGRG